MQAEHEAQVASLHSRLAELQEQQQQELRQAAASHHEELEAALAAAEQQHKARLAAEQQEHESALAEAQEVAQEIAQQLQEAEEQQEQQRQEAEEQAARLQQGIVHLEGQCSSLQEALAAVQQKHAADVHARDSSIAQLQQHSQGLAAGLSELQARQSELLAAHSALQADKAASEAAHQQQQEQLFAKISQMQELLVSEQHNAEQGMSALQQLQQEHQQLQQHCSGLQRQQQESSAGHAVEVQQLRQQVQALDAARGELSGRLSSSSVTQQELEGREERVRMVQQAVYADVEARHFLVDLHIHVRCPCSYDDANRRAQQEQQASHTYIAVCAAGRRCKLP